MVLSMKRWAGKIAVVTGASSGIGAAIAEQLVLHGLVVVGLARNTQPIKDLAKKLSQAKGTLHAIKCDITSTENVQQTFRTIEDMFGTVNILINNAGIIANTTLIDGDIEKWKKVFDTNVMGLCVATREALAVMRKHDVQDGHIIHINSIQGHMVVNWPGFNVYAASKHAVTALADTLRVELIHIESPIKISSISPGYTETNIGETAGFENVAPADSPALNAEDIAESVVFVLSTPPHVEVHELIIKPVGEKF